jgi:DNA-directed RNA polymerase specialized sigma24 family protein
VEKAQFKFVPVWEGPIEQYAMKFALKSVWRVQPDADLDDIMQEARILFLRCSERYWPEVETPQHFMALFKMSLMNKVINMANARTRSSRTRMGSITEQTPGTYEGYDRVEVNDLIASKKPEAIERLIRQLVKAKMKQRPIRKGKGPHYRRLRETTQQFLARVAHLGEGVDVVELVTQWVKGDVRVPNP